MVDIGDGIILSTSRSSRGVTFKCTYDMSIEVNSDEYNVNTVIVDGTESGSGKLDEGFKERCLYDSTWFYLKVQFITKDFFSLLSAYVGKFVGRTSFCK